MSRRIYHSRPHFASEAPSARRLLRGPDGSDVGVASGGSNSGGGSAGGGATAVGVAKMSAVARNTASSMPSSGDTPSRKPVRLCQVSCAALRSNPVGLFGRRADLERKPLGVPC
nr:uncharacterized protein LOC113802743 isoform X1 [Penaeus vannamei]